LKDEWVYSRKLSLPKIKLGKIKTLSTPQVMPKTVTGTRNALCGRWPSTATHASLAQFF
jgi:hypothetical protein